MKLRLIRNKNKFILFLFLSLLPIIFWLYNIVNINSNRLRNEKSPYLLQHKDNPVDWFPWGEEAFQKAVKEDKPIFLSIGYSTCHWCHVMEHESFEDEEVAKLLNQSFISIKVDREERPDIDHIYMDVCQMLNNSGGWPLTIIMTPQKEPFFAATYIPKNRVYNRIGMMELLPKVASLWNTQREEILQTSSKIVESLKQISDQKGGSDTTPQILDKAYSDFENSFDPEQGGFGRSPKFPSPHNLSFLLHYGYHKKSSKAIQMVEKTLQNMRRGGIYDHIGFGFHRYSTDSEWLVPHFEKMLYDQAMISIAYLDAYQLTQKEEYAVVVQEIFHYIMRDMTSEKGGFYSAEDADSEGVEGKFYVWSEKELKDILSQEEFKLISKIFNISKEGNYLDESTRVKSGKNILFTNKSNEEIASSLQMPKDIFEKKLDQIRQKIFEQRKKRIYPLKDDKILTNWNGLMIAALAKGSVYLKSAKYKESAVKAYNFIESTMALKDNRILHRYRDGEANIQGILDDYAFLIWGLLELYQTDFEIKYLEKAIGYTKTLFKNFWDEKNHGFYLTEENAEQLIIRPKEIYDGAIPSGNSVMMLNLLKLNRITGDSKWEDIALKILSAFSKSVHRIPSAHSQLLLAAQFLFNKTYEIVIVGESNMENIPKMLNALNERFIPNKVLILKNKASAKSLAKIAPFTSEMTQIDQRPTAYVCHNFSCKQPTTKIEEMMSYLKQ